MARYFMMNTGAKMPSIGLGTYLSKEGHFPLALECALKTGYRHIDTAHSYKNEEEIGDVLKKQFQEGKVKREELFITTKVPPVYLHPGDVQPCVLESLEKFKLKYVDMLLIHAPWGLQNRGDGELKPTTPDGQPDMVHHDLMQAWKVFESLFKMGLTKAIGVSNFTLDQLKVLWLKSKIKPANLQLECNAYCQQHELRKYCKEKNIVVTGYCPLGAPGRPSHHREPEDPVLLKDPVVMEIAKRHHKTPSQIVLAFLLQGGVAPLPKSVTPRRIEENFGAYDVRFSQGDLVRLMGLNRNFKFFRFPWFEYHPEYFGGQSF